jgi:uncharacterized protein YabE (DUF348 family)
MAAQGAVLAAVVGGTIAYAQGGTTVTLVLDGTSTTVQSGAKDVRGLLADEGITVSGRDLVAPLPASPLQDGERVVVRFARPIALTVDGRSRTIWTTELTLGSALRALGIRADRARLSVSRSQPLGRTETAVMVSTPKRVTVIGEGRTRDLTTTAVTVSDLLAEAGLTPRMQDQLSALPGTPVVPGLVVALTRIDRKRVSVAEVVPAPVTQKRVATMDVGTRQVVARGRSGRRTVVYQVVLADGRQVGRTALSSVVTSRPVTSVVKVGTRRVTDDGSGGDAVAGADGLNWAALARCESGGNPRAVNPAGYYGLYQFSPSTWQRMGGSGLPSDASPDEQLRRAKLLYKRSGAGQWGCGRHLYD